MMLNNKKSAFGSRHQQGFDNFCESVGRCVVQGCELTVARQVHACILLYQLGNEVVVPFLGGHDQRSGAVFILGIDSGIRL